MRDLNMSLQERTLVIKNFDPERTTSMLLKELCIQGGPVRNVVVKPDHAFVEFEDLESVGYTKALLDGVELFGQRLSMEPKLRYSGYILLYQKYNKMLEDCIIYHKHQQRRMQLQQQQQQLMGAYYNNQPSMQPSLQQPVGHPMPFLDPGIAMNNTPIVNPQVFDLNSSAQNLFMPHPNQVPTTSMQRNNFNNDLQRSRSFNHRQHRSNWDSKNRRRR